MVKTFRTSVVPRRYLPCGHVFVFYNTTTVKNYYKRTHNTLKTCAHKVKNLFLSETNGDVSRVNYSHYQTNCSMSRDGRLRPRLRLYACLCGCCLSTVDFGDFCIFVIFLSPTPCSPSSSPSLSTLSHVNLFFSFFAHNIFFLGFLSLTISFFSSLIIGCHILGISKLGWLITSSSK